MNCLHPSSPIVALLVGVAVLVQVAAPRLVRVPSPMISPSTQSTTFFRAAIEHERNMRAKNYQLSEVMEKHMISMTHEGGKLRSELESAKRRAISVATVEMEATAPGTIYAAQYGTLEAGYGENSRSDPNVFHQETDLRGQLLAFVMVLS